MVQGTFSRARAIRHVDPKKPSSCADGRFTDVPCEAGLDRVAKWLRSFLLVRLCAARGHAEAF